MQRSATPLHQAALGGHLDITRVLVDAGAWTELKHVRYGRHAARLG